MATFFQTTDKVSPAVEKLLHYSDVCFQKDPFELERKQIARFRLELIKPGSRHVPFYLRHGGAVVAGSELRDNRADLNPQPSSQP